MFKLNKKIKYALVALKYMREKKTDEITSVKEICALYHVPFDPTARALQLLAQKGILRACQGAHGGYTIKKDLSRVSLKELNDIIIGPIRIADCLDDDIKECDCAGHCNVISPLLELNERIHDFMEDISVDSLINQRHRREVEIRKKASMKQGTSL